METPSLRSITFRIGTHCNMPPNTGEQAVPQLQPSRLVVNSPNDKVNSVTYRSD